MNDMKYGVSELWKDLEKMGITVDDLDMLLSDRAVEMGYQTDGSKVPFRASENDAEITDDLLEEMWYRRFSDHYYDASSFDKRIKLDEKTGKFTLLTVDEDGDPIDEVELSSENIGECNKILGDLGLNGYSFTVDTSGSVKLKENDYNLGYTVLEGLLNNEIMPVSVDVQSGTITVSSDDLYSLLGHDDFYAEEYYYDLIYGSRNGDMVTLNIGDSTLANLAFAFSTVNDLDTNSSSIRFVLGEGDSELLNYTDRPYDFAYESPDSDIVKLVNSLDFKNLDREDKQALAKLGFFYCDGQLYKGVPYEKLGINAANNDDTYNIELSFSANSEYAEDVLLFFGLNGSANEYYLSDYYKKVNDGRNGVVSAMLDNKLGVSGLKVTTVDKDGNLIFNFNVDDAMNSNYMLTYKGFPLYVDASLLGDDTDFLNSLDFCVEKFLKSALVLDRIGNEDYGFFMSMLIDSDLEGFSDKYKLKELGYSRVELLENGNYKIYLENGQGYEISSSSFHQISDTIDNVNSSSAMQCLNLSNYIMKQTGMEGFNVDVRESSNEYSVYINGKLYTVDKKDIDLYDSNGNLKLSVDEINKKVFEKVSSDLALNYGSNSLNNYLMQKFNLNKINDFDVQENEDTYTVSINGIEYVVRKDELDVEKDKDGNIININDLATALFDNFSYKLPPDLIYSSSGYSYIPTTVLNPILQVEDIEVYRKICSELKTTSDKIFDYGNSMSSVEITEQYFTMYNNDLSSYVSKIKTISDDFVNFAEKIQACVDYIRDMDKSLQSTLDGFIEEFFDNVASQKVIRNEGQAPTVDKKSYIEFFDKKLDEVKEILDLYDLYECGMVEITGDTYEKMLEAGFEITTPENSDKHFVDISSFSAYISKRDKIFFTDSYSIYNWAIENFEKDENNVDAQLACTSYLYYQDVADNLKMKENLQGLYNTKAHLNTIFSDEYHDVLVKIENGEPLEFSYTYKMLETVLDENGEFKYQEVERTLNSEFTLPYYATYLTDTQKAFMFVDGKNNAIARTNQTISEINEKHEKDKANNEYFTLSKDYEDVNAIANVLEFNLNHYYQESSNTAKSFAGYPYEQIEGYNNAIEKIKKWLKDGEIDWGEMSAFFGGQFIDGFFDTPADMLYLIDPDKETTSHEYMMKYMSEFMTSSTSMSINQIKSKCLSGDYSEIESQMRQTILSSDTADQLDSMDGWGQFFNKTGSLVYDIFLDKLCPSWLSTSVKALSKAGSTVHDSREKGYSLGASYFAGIVSGLVTAGANSEICKKFVKDHLTKSFSGLSFSPIKIKSDSKKYTKDVFAILGRSGIIDAADDAIKNDYYKILESGDWEDMIKFINKHNFTNFIETKDLLLAGYKDTVFNAAGDVGISLVVDKGENVLRDLGTNAVYMVDNGMNGTNNEFNDVVESFLSADDTVEDATSNFGSFFTTSGEDLIFQEMEDGLKFLLDWYKAGF